MQTCGTSDAFVHDVKAAPDPQCVLFFDWQLNDLVRLLTDSRQFSVLTADTTYNLGQFYVTPITYRHLMLVDITSQKHQQWLAPSSYIRGKILHLSITLPIPWSVLKRSSSSGLWYRWWPSLDWSICPQLPFCQAALLFHPHEKEHLHKAQR